MERSCGNRQCPNCGKDTSTRWLEKQADRLLPVHHFLATFTVPDRIGWVLRGSQRGGYAALLDAGAESMDDVGSATKSLRGCRLGFFGVLPGTDRHGCRIARGRDPMVYHPHAHFVVAGRPSDSPCASGGVREDGCAWQATPENFLFAHATLIRVYKAKLADHLRACGLYDAVPAEAWQGKFVVEIKPVGDGQAVLKYLAFYVNRVAISDNRIVGCDDSSVTFRYTPSKKGSDTKCRRCGSTALR